MSSKEEQSHGLKMGVITPVVPRMELTLYVNKEL